MAGNGNFRKTANEMAQKTLFVFILLIYTFESNAQDTIRTTVFPFDTTLVEDEKVDTIYTNENPKFGSFESKFYYGGYLSLTFGTYTSIGAEPLLAYKLTPKLSLGTKLTYEYIRTKESGYVYEESNYGFSLFSRMRVTPGLYAHAEFSEMNYKFYNDLGRSDRKWVPFLFLGGGISQPVSRNTWFNAELLFDVLQNENSPYKDWEPFYSVGFGVGF